MSRGASGISRFDSPRAGAEKSRMRNFLIALATFFGVGRLPKGPGTWGTLATIPLAVLLAWLGPIWHMLFVIALLPISIVSAELYERQKGSHDAKEIVIDEVVGFLIAMTWLPFTWQSFVAGFLLFRALDILKPFPISVLDRKVKGGFGVVVDDVAAGLIANILLQLVVTHTMWLGVQSIVIPGQ